MELERHFSKLSARSKALVRVLIETEQHVGNDNPYHKTINHTLSLNRYIPFFAKCRNLIEYLYRFFNIDIDYGLRFA